MGNSWSSPLWAAVHDDSDGVNNVLVKAGEVPFWVGCEFTQKTNNKGHFESRFVGTRDSST